MRRRMSPPRTIRRQHGANYGGCLIYIVGGLGAIVGVAIKIVGVII